ncbi:hypothetical protein [Streptomyces pacificus]|uniref:Uncharacterized protein n=1 Tax=Streptomyces pacificus TaxID=2705029 RepID=A0A6A0APD1_9ACTN|nr:hypothetical protein [Streptomyces pacificus]GFH34498.1 hypothetical protein SCWH03_07120 [Streptomyces pacificus]
MTAEPLPSPSSVVPDAVAGPYRALGALDIDGVHSAAGPNPAAADVEGGLRPPVAEQRLSLPIAAHDRRRLDLHSALTANGVAPLPGDLDAIDVLSALDDRTVETVLHWIAVPGPRPVPAV